MQDSIWAGYVKVHQVNGVTTLFITDITKGLSQSQAAKLPGDWTLLPLPWHQALASNTVCWNTQTFGLTKISCP